MTGAIPKYGANFRRESVPWIQGLSSTRYVFKGDELWFIRSDVTREHWQIFIAGPEGAAWPLGKPLDTFTEAMSAVLTAHAAVNAGERITPPAPRRPRRRATPRPQDLLSATFTDTEVNVYSPIRRGR